jgi:hypothetical protein
MLHSVGYVLLRGRLESSISLAGRDRNRTTSHGCAQRSSIIDSHYSQVCSAQRCADWHGSLRVPFSAVIARAKPRAYIFHRILVSLDGYLFGSLPGVRTSRYLYNYSRKKMRTYHSHLHFYVHLDFAMDEIYFFNRQVLPHQAYLLILCVW